MTEKKGMQGLENDLKGLSPASVEVLYAAAHAYYKNGQYEQACHFFRFLTLKAPEQPRNWKGLAASHQLLKNYETAIDYWGVAALMDEKDYTTHLQAAHCFLALDDKKQAFQALDAAEIVGEGQASAKEQITLLRTAWQKEKV